MSVKLLRTTKIIFGSLLLFFVFRVTFLLFLRDFDRFLHWFVNLAHHPSGYGDLKDNPIVHMSFYLLRAIFCFLVFYIGYRIYAYIFLKDEYLFPKNRDRITNNIAESIHGNAHYIKTLDRLYATVLWVLLGLQFSIFLYFLNVIPYHYDEAFSFMHFAKEGALTSLTFYPVPNNHVLFNVVSSYFLWLPIDDIIALRLSSFVISLFSTYYFFKIAHKFFSTPVALIGTALFSFSGPCVMYGTQGRGYSMLIFFALLSIYSVICIMQGFNTKKYLNVYAFASVLGFLTMPSFLYCFVPVSAFLFFYLLLANRKYIKGFFVNHIIICLATALSYLSIILLNGLKALTQENGVAQKHDMTYIKGRMFQHLDETWRYITGGSELPLYTVMLLLFACLLQLRKGSLNRNAFMLFFILIISPVFILLIHRTVPFPRTWSYLIIPVTMAVTGLIQELSVLMKKNFAKPSAALMGSVLLIVVFFSARANKNHRLDYHIDYVNQQYANILDDKFNRIQKTGRFGEGLAFYVSENMEFESYRRNPDKSFKGVIMGPGDTTLYDLIVGDKNLPFPQAMENYDSVNVENDYFQVWIRRGL